MCLCVKLFVCLSSVCVCKSTENVCVCVTWVNDCVSLSVCMCVSVTIRACVFEVCEV